MSMSEDARSERSNFLECGPTKDLMDMSTPAVPSSAPLMTLLDSLGEDARIVGLAAPWPLCVKRLLAITCKDARRMMNELLHTPVLYVEREDATWDNCVFVARLPHLCELRVQGELCLPALELSRYRTLARLKVGELGVPAALFFGAAIATSDATLRLSDGKSVKNLGPMRTSIGRGTILVPTNAGRADLAALLGALSLNTSIESADVGRCVPLPPEGDDLDSRLLQQAYARAAPPKLIVASLIQNGVRLSRGDSHSKVGTLRDTRAFWTMLPPHVSSMPYGLTSTREHPGPKPWHSELWARREVVLAGCLHYDGLLLGLAPARIRADLEVCSVALEQNWMAAVYVADELVQSDAGHAIVAAAVLRGTDHGSLQTASMRALSWLHYHGWLPCHTDTAVRDALRLAAAAVDYGPHTFRASLSHHLGQASRTSFSQAQERAVECLLAPPRSYAAEGAPHGRLSDDRDVMLALMRGCGPIALHFASIGLLADAEFRRAAREALPDSSDTIPVGQVAGCCAKRHAQYKEFVYALLGTAKIDARELDPPWPPGLRVRMHGLTGADQHNDGKTGRLLVFQHRDHELNNGHARAMVALESEAHPQSSHCQHLLIKHENLERLDL